MKRQRGITLVELLMTLAIAAILLSLAAPSFRRMILANSMSTGVNTFTSDMRYARSEAVRLGGRVILCRSDDPENATPTCAANASTSGGKGWATGWVIFHDRDASNTWTAGDPVLRVQAPLSGVDAVLENADANNSTMFRFAATGRLMESANARLNFGGSNYDDKLKRVICVSAGGRSRIAGDGTTSCGTNNE
ncbi:prepilin-type N-terminal cleavage/methylation domain-containing protein [Caenimonas sedimenti]|uniref:Type II secretion system protein H n=1 Tax=Caenimonas sedimenti TaxID=2596921 RepID=A0A562ZKS0_9BURK|nr:GspH/FimT family pseudopilin [Caenimonas sedimenti]TWO69083.1 prepilin-type N-terminal cleavage/methylation domain-containing protein [Caenimonas sedimenti]